MDVDSGKLIRDMSPEQAQGLGLVPVPGELQADAEEALDGKEETTVNLRENSPLANWARGKQRCKRLVARGTRDMAKASRRRNR